MQSQSLKLKKHWTNGTDKKEDITDAASGIADSTVPMIDSRRHRKRKCNCKDPYVLEE